MHSACRTVDVLDYQVDDAYAYDQVIGIKKCIVCYQDKVIERTGFAVTSESDHVGDAVEDRYDQHDKQDAALSFTRRKDPSSRYKYDHEDGDSDQIGNIYSLQVDS